MKPTPTHILRLLFSRVLSHLLLCAFAVPCAHAAAPQIRSLRAAPVAAGQALDILADVADTDGDLDFIIFQIKGPNDTAFQQIVRVEFDPPTTQAFPSTRYNRNAPGLYTVKAILTALDGTVTAETETEIYNGSLTIPPLTIANGQARLITTDGELLTTDTSGGAAPTTVESGGNFILWAGGRVVLKPGFHAKPGSYFWAAIDHNGDGYSDLEEQQDTDGDGMFDAWEVDHGLNMLVNDAHLDPDNDGQTNLQEFQARTNPRDPNTSPGGASPYVPTGPATGPSAYDVILRLPGAAYRGFVKASGTFINLPAP